MTNCTTLVLSLSLSLTQPYRQVWGNASGGYADELRLKSSPATDDGNGTYINLRAHGGSLDFENTKVSQPTKPHVKVVEQQECHQSTLQYLPCIGSRVCPRLQ